MKISQETVTNIDGYIANLMTNNQEADTKKAFRDKSYIRLTAHLFYKNINLII